MILFFNFDLIGLKTPALALSIYPSSPSPTPSFLTPFSIRSRLQHLGDGKYEHAEAFQDSGRDAGRIPSVCPRSTQVCKFVHPAMRAYLCILPVYKRGPLEKGPE